MTGMVWVVVRRLTFEFCEVFASEAAAARWIETQEDGQSEHFHVFAREVAE